MKNLVTVLAIAALMTSCQKEDLSGVCESPTQEVSNYVPKTFTVLDSYLGGITYVGSATDNIVNELCEPTEATPVETKIQEVKIWKNHITINSNDELMCLFTRTDDFPLIAQDGTLIFVEALKLRSATDNEDKGMLILFDECGGDNVSMYFFESELLLVTQK